MDIPGIMLGYSGWRPGCAAGSAGLVVDTRYGIPVVSHGRQHVRLQEPDDSIALPDHGVGAVILTNSDGKCYLSGLFGRRLLEMLFDGKLGTAPSPRARTTTGRSFVTIDPAVDGFAFVVGERDGKQSLVIRDAQHEYPLIEQP